MDDNDCNTDENKTSVVPEESEQKSSMELSSKIVVNKNDSVLSDIGTPADVIVDNAVLFDILSEVVLGEDGMEGITIEEETECGENIQCSKIQSEPEQLRNKSAIMESVKSSHPYVDHGYCRTLARDSGDLSDLSNISGTQLKIGNLDKLGKIVIQENSGDNGEASCAKKIKFVEQNPGMTNHFQRQRKDPCPSLTKEHIDLLLGYLSNPELCVTEKLFLMQLKLSNFPRVKRYSVASQLKRWSKYLMKRNIDGQDTLCLRVSEKVILPREKYGSVIKNAHENTGSFCKKDSKCKGKINHNSFHRTFSLIEAEYGVGGREFGMSKYTIYKHVANCTGCTSNQKRLPSISKVLSSSDSCQLLYKNKDEVPLNTVEPKTESGVGDDNDGPISMLWEKPSPGSIWHNQQGLASQHDPYVKLLGVIREIGLDLTSSVQGDIPSKSKFLTKLYCATRLIQEMKSACERGDMLNNNEYSQFMREYYELQEVYVDIGKLDLFLYDVNLLAMKYNLTKNELFMQVVNNCVARFSNIKTSNEEHSLFDTPIDLVGIDVP